MSGEYPRVLAHDLAWIPALVDGPATHKVVPADAIVIERGDLPEVREDGSVLVKNDGPNGDYTYYLDAPEDGHAAALAHIAIHEYRAAQPSVDPSDVDNVLHILANATDLHGCSDGWDLPALARRLVERGVKPEPIS